jgi:hypothetical protein
MAYKVFTNGSVLNASEINENLMRQSVIVFSNAAARTAAITSPVEGMLTWLEDVNRYEFYNGTAWVSDNTGLIRLASETFSGVTAVNFNSVFSDLYRDYFFNFAGVHSSSSNFLYRLRSGVTDNTASQYFAGAVQMNESSGPTRIYEGSQTWSRIGNFQNFRNTMGFTISEPFNAITTTSFSQTTAVGSSNVYGSSWGHHNVSTSFDGISFHVSGGTMSGTIMAYGYRR